MGLETIAFLAVITMVGAGFFIAGYLAYAGRWRRWAAYKRYWEFGKTSHFGFICLFVGIAVLVLPLSALMDELLGVEAVARAVAWLALPAGLLAVISFVGLPGILKPRWYKEWVARGAIQHELYPPAAPGAAGWLRKR
ncbi:hypothetical protein [Crystallibacter degradans]|uniref:hypothetical protein n=1 Tax=Crystallibacter degradans TaxID=2726743 RepID=UPI0014762A3F|nr:hypothetical protein [Arthrobacter sp. SF27]NMR29042.1 hypothetical protein [Arthrobacter sp. SF27]